MLCSIVTVSLSCLDYTFADVDLLRRTSLKLCMIFYCLRRYVIFPIQVLAKSCKPVPVMLFGAIMGKVTNAYCFACFGLTAKCRLTCLLSNYFEEIQPSKVY